MADKAEKDSTDTEGRDALRGGAHRQPRRLPARRGTRRDADVPDARASCSNSAASRATPPASPGTSSGRSPGPAAPSLTTLNPVRRDGVRSATTSAGVPGVPADRRRRRHHRRAGPAPAARGRSRPAPPSSAPIDAVTTKPEVAHDRPSYGRSSSRRSRRSSRTSRTSTASRSPFQSHGRDRPQARRSTRATTDSSLDGLATAGTDRRRHRRHPAPTSAARSASSSDRRLQRRHADHRRPRAPRRSTCSQQPPAASSSTCGGAGSFAPGQVFGLNRRRDQGRRHRRRRQHGVRQAVRQPARARSASRLTPACTNRSNVPHGGATRAFGVERLTAAVRIPRPDARAAPR